MRSWRSFRAAPAPVVKSLTNDILVPADAEVTLEGYLDERGYVEPEGPYGEYMGYYGSIHMDPVFHCTAITMRADVLHHTLLHGSAFKLDETDSAVISVDARRSRGHAHPQRLRARAGRGLLARNVRRLEHAAGLDPAARLRRGASSAIAALFGGIMRLKHVYVFDEDIDIHDDRQVEWAMGTRFQADQDLMVLHGIMGMTMDPSLQGRRTGAKSGFDCTRAVRPRRRNSADALRGQGVLRPGALSDRGAGARLRRRCSMPTSSRALGSRDGREVACALDELRQAGKLSRDRDGRYHLARLKARRDRHHRRDVSRPERGYVIRRAAFSFAGVLFRSTMSNSDACSFPPRDSGEGDRALARWAGRGTRRHSCVDNEASSQTPPPPRKRAVPLPRYRGGGCNTISFSQRTCARARCQTAMLNGPYPVARMSGAISGYERRAFYAAPGFRYAHPGYETFFTARFRQKNEGSGTPADA